jgi:hypothetical protein
MFSYQTGRTALYAATQEGHVEVVTFLVNGGADVNIQEEVSTRIGCVYKQIRMNMYITKNSYIINEYNISYM